MTQPTPPPGLKESAIKAVLALFDYLIENPGPINTKASAYVARIEDIEEAHRALEAAGHE